ncbi:MAG: OmpA family protein, partial [Chitinophagaceae bacterium]
MSKIITYNPFRFFKQASIYFTVCCCLFAVSVVAQSRSSYKRKADALFKEQNYYAAAQLYNIALTGNFPSGYNLPYQPSRKGSGKKAKGKDAIYLTYQLAQSYRLYKYYDLADTFYSQYLSLTKTPDSLTRLWYGETLRANNKPEDAIIQLNQFITEHATDDAYTQLAKFELANAYFNINQRNLPVLFAISKLNFGNSKGSTYALEKLNDTTFYYSQSTVDSSNKKDITYPSKLYTTNLSDPTAHTLSIAGMQYDKASSHVTKDGLTMYFTAWKETYVAAKNSYAIYFTQRSHIDSNWSTPVKLSDVVNVPGFNAKQPFVTADNRFLLFSSNRMGGKGNYDIWIAPLVNYQAVGSAINAGDSINTTGDEITPFYFNQTEELYYSTNGKIGMGGLDIVKSKGSVEKNTWTSSVNLGASLNSVRDDAYYKKYSESIGDTSYFSSDRDAICCLEIFQSISLKPTVELVVDTTTKIDTPIVSFDSAAFIPNVKDALRKHLLDSINSASLTRTEVKFDFAKSAIRESEKSSLDTIIQIVKYNPDLNIVIAAFTDCKGKQSVNKRLSRARAESVKKYLVKKGIKSKNVNIDFYVDNQLVLPCKDDSTYNKKEQEANRRADIIVTKDKNKRWTPSGKELNIDEILTEIREGKRKITFTDDAPKSETKAERKA